LVIFAFIIQSALIIGVSVSEAYNFSKNYIKNNSTLVDEIGTIDSMTLLPFGSINTSKKLKQVNKRATLNFLVKGNKTSKLVNISIQKTQLDNDWIIVKFN